MRMINKSQISTPGELVLLRPNKDYARYKIGTPVRDTEVNVEAEIFDLSKLEGFKLFDRGKPGGNKEYSSTNNFNESESSYALGLGLKGKLDLTTTGVEAQYMMNIANANLKTQTYESVFMLYKYDGNYIALNFGPSNHDKIVASLKVPVANLYWKIVSESSSFDERLMAYYEFIDTFGTGCITRLNLISYSVAKVVYKETGESSNSKNEHEFTFGATFSKMGSIAASVQVMESASEKNKDLKFYSWEDTYPFDSPCGEWISALNDSAIEKIENKEWKEVKEPKITPAKPVLPEYPKIDPKKSEEQTFETLNQEFNGLSKATKPFMGLKMYNLAQKELVYATESGNEKHIETARNDIDTSIDKLNGNDKTVLDDLNIDNVYIKGNDASLAFLFAQSVVKNKISAVDYAQSFSALKEKYKDEINNFANEEAIDTFVNNLKGVEITNVNAYANVLISYKTVLDLVPVQISKAEWLYNKTKKAILMSDNEAREIPVTEEQYLDSVLLLQMKNDCFDCTDLEVYKKLLKQTKADFYTTKIIEEILDIELKLN